MHMKKTINIICVSESETIQYAGTELAKYIMKMDSNCTVLTKSSSKGDYERQENEIWLGLDGYFNKHAADNDKTEDLIDAVTVDVERGSGIISGVNERSVLFGVYQFLTYAGCRWIRPGVEGEIVPLRSINDITVHIKKEASNKHRGVCIEGAISLENVLEMVEFLPKLGFNAYFTQFRESYTFFERWYTHRDNPLLKPEEFSIEKAREIVEVVKREVKRRGLLYHAVGHGWTCEPFGLEGTGWDPKVYDLSPEITKNFALVNGKREVWQGIPLNTNLCYSSDSVRDIIITEIIEYLQSYNDVDYLHVWLADGFNNHCECDECVKITPSDIYVTMLNELDRRLTEKDIDSKIVFLIYFELLWPPLTEKLINQDRFILMFAPITRTYSMEFSCEAEAVPIPEFYRNKITLPQSVEENVAFLAAWQKLFSGDSFDFDYHLYVDHYNDPGYYAISKVIYNDVKNLKKLGLNGLMSCQVHRSFLPTGFPMYVMGKVLWDDSLRFEDLEEDYFMHAYGPDGMLCKNYLSQLSESFNPPYWRNETEQISQVAAEQFEKIPDIIHAFSAVVEANQQQDDATVEASWRYIEYHSHICKRLASILYHKATGNNAEMRSQWHSLTKFVQENEMAYQQVFDVQMFISVLKSKFDI